MPRRPTCRVPQAAYTSATATAGTAIVDLTTRHHRDGRNKAFGRYDVGPTPPTALTAASTLTVDGKTITFVTTGATSTSSTGGTINVSTGTVQDVLDAIDKVTGTFGTGSASRPPGARLR